MEPLKMIVAVTGASGCIYAKLLLNELRMFRLAGQVAEVSVVFSEKAKEVWMHEIGSPPNTQPFSTFDNGDFNAPFASGSSLYDAMLICPCSMGAIGRLACGLSDTLISRAADVMLKERRRLILAIRETPLHLMHLAHLHTLTQAGAIVAPASPSFYSHPQSIEALAMTVVDRLLQLAGLRKETYRWGQS